MVRSRRFGSNISDQFALFRLAFAMAPDINSLTKPDTLTRRLILQQARSHPNKLELLLLVGKRFHVLFHSPPGVLFTFPSLYLYAIGHQSVFSLTKMVLVTSIRISRVPTYLGYCSPCLNFIYRTITFYGQAFQLCSIILASIKCSPSTPISMLIGLGYFHFTRRYSGNHYCFLFLQLH